MKKIYPAILILLLSCGDSTGPSLVTYTVITPENPEPRGERVFGINPSESEQGFQASFDEVMKAGIQVVEINLRWEDIETSQGVYQDPYGILSAITFYGYNNIEVLLTISVINTVKSTVPEYLQGYQFSDEEVITAFNEMSDWVFQQIDPSVQIAGFSIGNEIDIYLNGQSNWQDYTQFYQATSSHAKQQRPSIPIGVKCTVTGGLLSGELSEVQAINSYSDVIMLNYYPNGSQFTVLDPTIVHTHFNYITQSFPNKDIWFTELGYQSGSEYCASSETKQAQFYHEMFSAWDNHSTQISLVLVDWLHDATEEQLEEWIEYYGLSDPGFVEFLATLGLRNYDHTDKYAWLQLLAETEARGW